MKDLIVERCDVWAASIKDEPGGLAQVLTALGEAGADLDFVIARRSPEGGGVVYLTPLRGDAEVQAAGIHGFRAASSVHSVRVEGDNASGIGAQITSALSAAGLNLRGFSAAVIGARFVVYIGLDSAADADKAVTVLAAA
jgi:hypothetical protein